MTLQSLYQELIIDHATHPRGHFKMNDATHTGEGFNPLCGDKIMIYLKIENSKIQSASFVGTGCAISTASASLMTESLIGKTLAQAERLFKTFQIALTDNQSPNPCAPELGKLTALLGVREFPTRVKCATLAWHTLQAAFKNEKQPASTE